MHTTLKPYCITNVSTINAFQTERTQNHGATIRTIRMCAETCTAGCRWKDIVSMQEICTFCCDEAGCNATSFTPATIVKKLLLSKWISLGCFIFITLQGTAK